MKNLEKEFLNNKNKKKDKKRLENIYQEFKQAYDQLASIPAAVSIFGSARTPRDDKYYNAAYELSTMLSQKGYAIITGGGGGIMEAANKGADISIGLRIKLPQEQHQNKFVKKAIEFKYFFARKVNFMKYSVAFIVMSGGFGTLDELAEALCLVQTDRIGRFPIVFFGKDFFSPLESFFEMMLEHNYIRKDDMDLYLITDDIDEAVEYITNKKA